MGKGGAMPEEAAEGATRRGWAWTLAGVVGTVLLLCAAYDSSSADTVRGESRLQAKVSALLREANRLQGDSLHAQAMAKKYARMQQPAFAKIGGKGGQALYDVPSFTEEHTRMHFPQAEAGWLDMAARGEIGDDVKTDDEQGNLTSVIDEWRERAYTEKKEAREEAAIAAREENYVEYNITKGVATHKIYTGTAPPLASAATKHAGAPPQLAGKKASAPQLKGAAVLPKDVVLKIHAAKGAASLAVKARQQAQERKLVRRSPVALPARVRAEEQIMERAFKKEVAAQQRVASFRAEMKATMHTAQMKLAHQEMGLKARRGPVAERDEATAQSLASMGLGLVPVATQKLGEMGLGPEGDHMVAIKKAEIVNGPLADSLIDSNEVTSSLFSFFFALIDSNEVNPLRSLMRKLMGPPPPPSLLLLLLLLGPILCTGAVFGHD